MRRRWHCSPFRFFPATLKQSIQLRVPATEHQASHRCYEAFWASVIEKLRQARGNPMLNFIHSSKPTRMSKVFGTDFIAIASHNGNLKT